MRDAEDILDLYRTRKGQYSTLHAKMAQIAQIYNGNARVPLPDMERDELPSVPNLLAQGVDQMAGRITSVIPSVTFASAKPGVRSYDRRASDAARVITGWWQADRVPMKQKQRGRRLVAYGMAPVVIRWDHKDHRPTWNVRHPMETLPSPDIEPGKVTPDDCLFSFYRSAAWMRQNGYEHALRRLVGREQIGPDTQIRIVEYIDAEQHTLLAVGAFDTMYADPDASVGSLNAVYLVKADNPIEETPVIIPTRLTLDQMTGQFDNMVGMYYQQAKLMALETIAVEKGIFPDTYLISRQGEVGKFIDGPHDGRTGLVSVVVGGDIKEIQSQPGYLTNPTIDRIERSSRVTAGIPSEFGGESNTNIRTGRRGDAVLSAVIDFPVAEAQEMFAYALQEENEAAIALAKKYDGSASRTIYVGTGNARRPVTYTANKTFEVEEHVVSFPAAGSDVNSLIIGLGQRVGLGIMSKRTAAELDPFIDNPEQEHDAIISEGLEQALVSGIQQQAAGGQIPPLVLAKIMTLVSNDKMELAQAMTKVTEDAIREQEKQAQAQAAQQQQMTPDQAMAPGAMSAMAGPQAPIPGREAMPGMTELSQMLGTLRRPAMTIQPMRGVQQGAV